MSAPVYGSGDEACTGDVAIARLVTELELHPTDVAQALAAAGRNERPPIRTLEDLHDARPAVVYYVGRLLKAIAGERGTRRDDGRGPTGEERPMATLSGPSTNRPSYAPERRPGDPQELPLDRSSGDLVIIAFASGDVPVVAALIEAGAAALKYAPVSAVDVVEQGARKRHGELAKAVARTMRAELTRRTRPAKVKRKAKT